MLRLGVDAMGGDYAPEAAVMGAIQALDCVGEDVRIVLFGDKAAIEGILDREGCAHDKFDIVPTTEVIEMGDHPAQAFKQKQNSSIVVGYGYLKAGKIDGFASAGSTGAMMVGAMFVTKAIEGVIRPSISSPIPVVDGRTALMLDVGLNVDCRPDVLQQYGLLGSVYAETVLGIENPRVALLNIGEESTKGNLTSREAYELMKNSSYNFVGNIEGKHVFSGRVADVIVCDGFVGNVLLKAAESFYPIGQALGVGSNPFFDKLNYEFFGGTPVLGVNAPIIIGHGCSTPKAIAAMIKQTETTVRANFIDRLREAFK
ncbi:MAG: phosphate acyltransferase PlsX [Rikenellaceae bacterium]|nr:phosphate acyltransferase PlsX [Rikenellaceae bacterium]